MAFAERSSYAGIRLGVLFPNQVVSHGATMKIIQGNLWDSKADTVVVTTNGYIGNRGLVMGRGAAAEAALMYPGLQRSAGVIIEKAKQSPMIAPRTFVYGFVEVRSGAIGRGLGLLQVKYNWSDKANVYLIAFSAISLRLWMMRNPKVEVACNFPGIGYGGLDRKEVEPILQDVFAGLGRINFYIK